jgi:hypothetical protein
MIKFDKLLQRYENSIKQGIYTMDEAGDLLNEDFDRLFNEEYIKSSPYLTIAYLEESSKLREKICNDGKGNISERYFKEDLKLIKKHNITFPPIPIPEGYEVWKYDIETFEPILRKKV